jgi:hypothetical protein
MSSKALVLVVFATFAASSSAIFAPAPAPAGGEGEDSCDKICTPGEDKENPVVGAKCNAGCICKALTTGFTNPLAGPVSQSNMQLYARQVPSFPGSPGVTQHNLIDAICLGMGNPGAAKDAYNTAMGVEAGGEARFRFRQKMTAPAPAPAGSEGGGSLLGDNQECLDLCFRLSAYTQEHYDGLHCQLFKVVPATQVSDPFGIPEFDWTPAPAGGEARFKSEKTKISTSAQLPPLWQSMGLTPETLQHMSKTAKYATHSDHSPKSRTRNAQTSLEPALL